jgi:predicted ATPase/class 3 adenylate cyclase
MIVAFDDVEIHFDAYEIRRGGVPVPVEPQVFEVVRILVERQGDLVTKEELLDLVWGTRFVSESSLTSRIKQARRVLGDDGRTQRVIATVHGRGYRFVAPVALRSEDTAGTLEPRQSDEGDVGSDRRGAESEGARSGTRPSGTVTFLFTDVEGSTLLWDLHPTGAQVAIERHDEIVRSAIESHGGYVFSTAGDGFAAAFSRAADAVEAATEAQAALSAEVWPDKAPIRVRMGLHCGEAHERAGDYFGAAVNRAARLMAVGHGGQVLASTGVMSLVELSAASDLGEHRLRDLSAAERIWQIGAGTFPPLRTLDAVRTNLPVERTALVGRTVEIDEVGVLVGRHRLVTLLGIGGTGKTRLATAVAADIAHQFADGVWFVDLVASSDADQVAEATATAMGLQISGTDLLLALAELLADRDALVVLDNCEHVTDDAADVVDVLLERTSGPRFLVTSREPLQLPDERQHQVPPLAVADDPAAPAVQLFLDSAERGGVVVPPEDVATVAHICAHLDGLPLSVELAAAQLRQLSLTELAGRLGQRFELLARGRRRRGRQASLLAVLEDTWGMLDAAERELLLRVAAFPSSFTADDVDGIAGDLDVPTRTLAGLVDLGLVSRSGDERHRLLETVRLFARQRWKETTEPGVYLDRHTDWVRGHLDSFEPFERYTSFDVVKWAMDHYEDHRVVEDRFAAEGRLGDVSELLDALNLTYTYENGTRASALIDRAQGYLARSDLTDRDRGRLCTVAAAAGLPARRQAWIATSAHEAVELLQGSGAPNELAAALIIDSWMTVFQDFERAVGMLDRAQTLAASSGAAALASVALAYRASYHALAGRLDEADRLFRELEDRLDGSEMDYAGSLYGLFLVAARVVDDPETSRTVAEKLMNTFAVVAANFGPGFGANVCACVATAATGDVEATLRLVTKAREDSERANNDNGLPDLLLAPVAIAWRRGNLAAARRWLAAVRHAPKPTQTLQITLMYRLLRKEVEPLDPNPLETTSLDDIYREAIAWMGAL